MKVPAAVRRAGLTLHVASSVGWLGAVLVYAALGALVVTSDDVALVRGAYLVMDWAAPVVVVPLALIALVSGVAQSLMSSWGLWRHYWVVVKLVITALATAVLLLYTRTLSTFAGLAGPEPTAADLAVLGSPSVLLHATGALVLLGVATVLAIHKPAGLTRHGQRVQRSRRG